MSKIKYLWINSKIQSVLEKCAAFLAEVLDQSKDDEHFWECILGSLKIFLVNPSWFQRGWGFCHSHFKFLLRKIDMMQHSNA